MKIALGSDHAGFQLKEAVKRLLRTLGHEVRDFGTSNEDAVDFPDFILPAANAVADGEAERAIVFGGTGNGEAMAANKIAGIRAALCHDVTTARLSRQHNDANVLALGARIIGMEVAIDIIRAWMETAYEGGRHDRRLEKLHAVEGARRRTTPSRRGAQR